MLATVCCLVACTVTRAPVEMPGRTLAPTPTGGPTFTSTPDPCTGWWCRVRGVVYADTVGPGSELEGASVQLGQSSYCSPTRGRYQATTGPDGSFEFEKVFFHDTDRAD